jgi:hypothetical protein
MASRITSWRWRGRPTSSSASYTTAAVLIPLDQAHLHGYLARHGKAEYEELSDGDDGKLDGADGGEGRAENHENGEDEGEDEQQDEMIDDDEALEMLQMSAAEYSIDGLRKAARRGRGRSVSEYESAWDPVRALLCFH